MRDDPNRCPVCGQWFVVVSLLNSHMRREHHEEKAA
jgi:hypothetical protein